MTISVSPKHRFTFVGTTHNVFHAKTGEGIPKHNHTYPHVTAVHSGKVVVRKEGMEIVMSKHDQPVLLAANEWHEIEAIEDDTVFENIFPFGGTTP